MRLNYIDNIDCLEGLKEIPDNSVDLVITDPPYSSGGAFSGDRKSRTATKYTATNFDGASALPDFSGDNMDQLGFMEFTRQVFAKCREKTKPEGIVCAFIDWRNLPALCNSLQAAGWVWRGIAVWNKPNGRPQKGRFRNEFEFVVWGANGPMPFDRGVGCLPGYYRYANVAAKDRQHQTEKPLQLIEDLLEIVPKGATVLDPFMGSGTTAVAALRTGRNFIGFELGKEYHAIATERVAKEMMDQMDQAADLEAAAAVEDDGEDWLT
jgi:site-specific DNA-methyltransferase (adenine-specific)